MVCQDWFMVVRIRKASLGMLFHCSQSDDGQGFIMNPYLSRIGPKIDFRFVENLAAKHNLSLVQERKSWRWVVLSFSLGGGHAVVRHQMLLVSLGRLSNVLNECEIISDTWPRSPDTPNSSTRTSSRLMCSPSRYAYLIVITMTIITNDNNIDNNKWQ